MLERFGRDCPSSFLPILVRDKGKGRRGKVRRGKTETTSRPASSHYVAYHGVAATGRHLGEAEDDVNVAAA